jgi:hypothetical protein
MTRMEQGLALLLLAVSAVGGVLIPRLLVAPARPVGVAISTGAGRIVVEAPALPKAAKRVVAPRSTSVVRVVSAPVAPAVATTASQPKPQPVKREVAPPAPLAAPHSTLRATRPAAPLTAPTAPAPPTLLAAAKDGGRQDPSTARDRDLRGSGHGKAQVSPHPLGAHDRGLGHLAPAPAGATQAAHAGGPKARPENRGRGGGSGQTPPQAVAHGHGR